jgi:hypothetical protein
VYIYIYIYMCMITYHIRRCGVFLNLRWFLQLVATRFMETACRSHLRGLAPMPPSRDSAGTWRKAFFMRVVCFGGEFL